MTILVAAHAFPALGAEEQAPEPPPAPAHPAGPGPETFQREIRRLQDELQELRRELDQIRNAPPTVASSLVTVPAGGRQAAPFNTPAPDFGPSRWVPDWPPVVNPSPQSRELTPWQLGAVPPPPESPLAYAQFVPGSTTVEHGLGPIDVTVTLVTPGSGGGADLPVDANRIVARTSLPPDGTFTIWNYTEYPVTVRWVARRVER